MTKQIRIENADLSHHNVVVETWTKGVDGKPDTMVRSETLNHPTQLLNAWVWGNQYLIIREVK